MVAQRPIFASMRRILSGLIALLLRSPGAQAELDVRLSDTIIEELDSVQLLIRDRGTQQSETPDLSPLSSDFHVMGVNTSSQYRYTNGQTQSWVDYQITLQPKTVGRLTIPPITIGDKQTVALALDVRALNQDTRNRIDSLVFYEQDFSADAVYVQAELIMVRRLFYGEGVQLFGGQPPPPDIVDALVVELGEARTGTTNREGRSYGVFEQRFAIFPETSGRLSIPAASISASVRLFDQGRVTRKGVRIRTEPKTILVKPIPSSYPRNEPWLPAHSLQITQSLTPDLAEISTGESIQRRIAVQVRGNTGASIAGFDVSQDGGNFRLYPKPPQILDEARSDSMYGQRIWTADIVPLMPGAQSLPGLSISWWNTDTDALQVTTLDALALTVIGAAAPDTISAAIPREKPDSVSKVPAEPVSDNGGMSLSSFLKGLVGGLIGCAILLICITLYRKIRVSGHRLGHAKRDLDTLQGTLLHAIDSGRVATIRPALSAYVEARFRVGPSAGLEAFAQSSPLAGPFLEALARNAFSQASDQDATLNADQIDNGRRAVTRLTSPSRRPKRASLPPLYAG